jgi:hypothetical protein
MIAITVFVCMLELVESRVFLVEQLSILWSI